MVVLPVAISSRSSVHVRSSRKIEGPSCECASVAKLRIANGRSKRQLIVTRRASFVRLIMHCIRRRNGVLPESLTTPGAECDENIVHVPHALFRTAAWLREMCGWSNCSKTGLLGEREIVLEVVPVHMSAGFGQQQARA